MFQVANDNVPDIGIMVRVFANGSEDLGSSHTKDSKNDT